MKNAAITKEIVIWKFSILTLMQLRCFTFSETAMISTVYAIFA